MSDAVAFDRTIQMVEDRLSLNSTKQKLISGNLANINTPGYRTRELSFDNVLRESLEEQVLHMVRSNKSHFTPDEPLQAMQDQEVTETGPVDLDNEMVKLTKNSIEYQYMVSMLNKKFSMIKTALAEGGE